MGKPKKYVFTEDMATITSGLGDDVENACRAMVTSALRWLDENPDANPKFVVHKTTGMLAFVNDDAVKLVERMLNAVGLPSCKVRKAFDEDDKLYDTVLKSAFAHYTLATTDGWEKYAAMMRELMIARKEPGSDGALEVYVPHDEQPETGVTLYCQEIEPPPIEEPPPKPKKPVVEQKTQRQLKRTLSKDEWLEAGEAMASAQRRISELDAVLDEHKQRHKSEVKTQEGILESNSNLIRTKYELQEVECLAIYDYENEEYILKRTDDGEIVEQRRITVSELSELPLGNMETTPTNNEDEENDDE